MRRALSQQASLRSKQSFNADTTRARLAQEPINTHSGLGLFVQWEKARRNPRLHRKREPDFTRFLRAGGVSSSGSTRNSSASLQRPGGTRTMSRSSSRAASPLSRPPRCRLLSGVAAEGTCGRQVLEIAHDFPVVEARIPDEELAPPPVLRLARSSRQPAQGRISLPDYCRIRASRVSPRNTGRGRDEGIRDRRNGFIGRLAIHSCATTGPTRLPTSSARRRRRKCPARA